MYQYCREVYNDMLSKIQDAAAEATCFSPASRCLISWYSQDALLTGLSWLYAFQC